MTSLLCRCEGKRHPKCCHPHPKVDFPTALYAPHYRCTKNKRKSQHAKSRNTTPKPQTTTYNRSRGITVELEIISHSPGVWERDAVLRERGLRMIRGLWVAASRENSLVEARGIREHDAQPPHLISDPLTQHHHGKIMLGSTHADCPVDGVCPFHRGTAEGRVAVVVVWFEDDGDSFGCGDTVSCG